MIAAPAPPAASAQSATWPLSELVVSAARGPVFWRVRRGVGEVWILGVPEVFARNQRWDTRRLRRLLDGARELLTPPAYTLKDGRRDARDGRPSPIEARLAPDLAARVAAARREANVRTDRYDGLSLVDAAYRLRTDLYAAAGLTTDEPDRDVIGLAGRRFMMVRAVARYEAPLRDTEDAERGGARCVEGALSDAAFARLHAAAASRAWAIGDLQTVRAETVEPTVAACLDASSDFRALSERTVADTAAAIETALVRGGRTVAVLTLGALLNRSGVLARLRADGAEVTAPEAASSR